MDWAPIESQWESMYLLAKKYYEENGNLLIPNKYITAENVKLGKWLGTQRYNYKEGILAKDKIALLEKIGIVWTVSDYEWMKMYDLAAIYYKENGNLLVHNKYKTKDNTSLGAWVGQQRTNHYNKKLSKKKIELLDKIGMVWSLSDYEWMRMYSLATRYYAEKGNLAVPKDYKTKGNEYLGAWIDRQRKQKQDNKLSSKQINLLNKIGMEWSKTDYKWMAIYNSAVSYYDDHGDLLVPSRYATDDGIHLGTWIKHQRERYKKGIITATEEELLNNIDMIWDLKGACEKKSVKSQRGEAFCDKIKSTGGFYNGEQEERVLQTQAHDGGEAEHHPGTAAGVQHRNSSRHPGSLEGSAGRNHQGDDGGRDG